jgi:hypothetical protein
MSMSSYCLLEEALNLAPFVGELTDVPATVPSLTQAEHYVEYVSAEIDQHLAAKAYGLPVTDASSLLSLKTVAAYGIAALVIKAAYPSDQGYGGQNGSAGFYETKYQAGLGFIDSGELVTSAVTATSAFSHGFETATEKEDEDWPF